MIYTFASCELDKSKFEIRRDGERVSVEPQVFDLLLLLVENRDRLVSRDEIVESVWKGRFISESAISSRVKAARQAIGDDGKAQAIIRTVHGRGFRFVAEVTLTPDAAPPAEVASLTGQQALSPPALSNEVPMPASSGLAEASDALASVDGIDMSLPKLPSIVVLPFQVLNGDTEQQAIADALALDIMTGLARTRWLFVISRGTALLFRGAHQDVNTISKKLGVRYVLHGTVQFRGARVRIYVMLTDTIAGHELWADQYDRAVDDIFSVQDEISAIVCGMVETEIEQSERQRALMKPPASLDSWSAYHRGVWHMLQFEPAAYEEAERLFNIAAKLDPRSARVQAGLSFVHWQRAFLELTTDRKGEIERAMEFAQYATQLDPREPQGHWALGRAFILKRQFNNASEEIAQSLDLNPNFALGHYSMAFLETLQNRHKESGEEVQLARRLSPYDLMSFAMIATQAVSATMLGRLDEGADLADRATRQPNAHYHVVAIAAFANARAGRREQADRHLARLARDHPDYRITDFLRAFPYSDDETHRLVTTTFKQLGLPE